MILERKLSKNLIKNYKQEDFEEKVKEAFCKNEEDLNKSKKYKFMNFQMK